MIPYAVEGMFIVAKLFAQSALYYEKGLFKYITVLIVLPLFIYIGERRSGLHRNLSILKPNITIG